jgi:lysophospholipase L1-like esterase
VTLRIACLGDSLTRGQLSVDYLELVARRRPGAVELSRFAANGEFAYNLRQRLGPVLATPFDVVTVLIGTNDARAGLAGYPLEQAMRRKQLPTRPSAGWFQHNLGATVERLRSATDATIAVLSIPVLGQDPDAAPARASAEYSRLIAEVATTAGVGYLPLHERQVAEIRRAAPPSVAYREVTPAAFIGTVLQRSVLRRSLDEISRRRGLLLTVDHIHQNSRGAELIADVIGTELLDGLLDRSPRL